MGDALAEFALFGGVIVPAALVFLAQIAIRAHQYHAREDAYYKSDDAPVTEPPGHQGHPSFRTDPNNEGCPEWVRITAPEDI